jgi:hypothetical protein
MKTLIITIKSALQRQSKEIQEAPRFEEWYNQMFPKDTYNEQFNQFAQTMMEFKQEQKRKISNLN